jgi:hypothetical protein
MAQQQPPQQPPQQPQWSPPPQQPMGWGGPGYGGPPPRPTGVTMGAIFLIVMGVLTGLVGACSSLLGGAVGSAGGQDTTGLLSGLGMGLAVVGIILLVLGVLSVAAGAGALGGRGWARWLGVVISVVYVIFGVLGLLGSLAARSGSSTTGLGFSLVIAIGYALTAFAFISAGAYFARR